MTRQIFTVLALILVMAQNAFATEYKISVTGTVVNESASPTLFGIAQPTYPLNMSFKVDSSAAQLVPAGTIFDPDNGYHLAVDAYLIPRTAITELSAQVGTAAFETADIVNQTLGLSGSYDVMITGSLSNPDSVYFVLADSVLGDVSVGSLFCPTVECAIFPVGPVFSYTDNSFGSITGLEGTSEEVVVAPPTSLEQAIALIAQINTMGITAAQAKVIYSQAVRMKEYLAKGHLVKANLTAEILSKLIAAGVKSKALTLAQAAALNASLQALQDSLQE